MNKLGFSSPEKFDPSNGTRKIPEGEFNPDTTINAEKIPEGTFMGNPPDIHINKDKEANLDGTFNPDKHIDVSNIPEDSESIFDGEVHTVDDQDLQKIKPEKSPKFDPDQIPDVSTIPEGPEPKTLESTGKAEVNNSTDHNDVGKQTDTPEHQDSSEFNTTYKERLDHTPTIENSNGHWEGERGESKYIIENPEVKKTLEKYGVDGIEYKDGIPDFEPVSEATVEIDNMTENRHSTRDPETGEVTKGNFEQADEKCAEKFNEEAKDGKTDWTAADVKKYREDNNLTWHECSDGKTCMLIPRDVHETCRHTGGCSECAHKNNELANDGGFDPDDN